MAGLLTVCWPVVQRNVMNELMKSAGLEGEIENARSQRAEAIVVEERPGGLLDIGGISYQIVEPLNPELVPDIVFFEIPSHTLILRSMLKDYNLGEHLLLMGNQGVGRAHEHGRVFGRVRAIFIFSIPVAVIDANTENLFWIGNGAQ